jgi:hypothetical protein
VPRAFDDENFIARVVMAHNLDRSPCETESPIVDRSLAGAMSFESLTGDGVDQPVAVRRMAWHGPSLAERCAQSEGADSGRGAPVALRQAAHIPAEAMTSKTTNGTPSRDAVKVARRKAAVGRSGRALARRYTMPKVAAGAIPQSASKIAPITLPSPASMTESAMNATDGTTTNKKEAIPARPVGTVSAEDEPRSRSNMAELSPAVSTLRASRATQLTRAIHASSAAPTTTMHHDGCLP